MMVRDTRTPRTPVQRSPEDDAPGPTTRSRMAQVSNPTLSTSANAPGSLPAVPAAIDESDERADSRLSSLSTRERNRELESQLASRNAELAMRDAEITSINNQLLAIQESLARLQPAPAGVEHHRMETDLAHPMVRHQSAAPAMERTTSVARPLGTPLDTHASARRPRPVEDTPHEFTRAQSLRPDPRPPARSTPFPAQNPGLQAPEPRFAYSHGTYIRPEDRRPFIPMVPDDRRAFLPLEEQTPRPERRYPETFRLKPQDIGYWDPKAKSPSDNDDNTKSDRKLSLPVELFVRRLYKLAARHGEAAVLDNIETALVNVSSWMLSFSQRDEDLTVTLDGWCSLLLRDYGEPEVKARQRMREYDYSSASSATEFWTEKLGLLRISNYGSENDQYYEIWSSLPNRWKETIPMSGSLDSLKESLKQRETASGWPKRSSTSRKSSSSDSGYESSRPDKKRGALSSQYSDRSSKKRDSKTIPACRICEGLGKPDQLHWHADCPNNTTKSDRTGKLNAVLEQNEPEESDNDEDSGSDSTESEPGHTQARLSTTSVSRVYSDSIVNAVAQGTYEPRVFSNPQVFQSSFSSEANFGEGNMFQEAGPCHVYMRGSPKGADARVCADSGCGPSIGNRAFVNELFPQAIVRKCNSKPLRVKGGFDGGEYESLTDFVCVTGYLVTTKGNLLACQFEIHLTNSSVSSGILLGSSAWRTNGLTLNFKKEVLTTRESSGMFSIRVPVFFAEKPELMEPILVRAVKSVTIPSGAEGLVAANFADLPVSRTFWYQGRHRNVKKGEYAVPADSVVDHTCRRVVIANFGEKPCTIKRNEVLGRITEIPASYRITESGLPFPRPYFKDSSQIRGTRISNVDTSQPSRAAPESPKPPFVDFPAGNEPKEANVAISLAKFLEPFGVPETVREEDLIGVSRDDVISPRYREFVGSTLCSLARQTEFVDLTKEHAVADRWNFSSLLSEEQRSEIKGVLSSVKIWDGIGCLNTGEYIKMPIKPEFEGKASIQAPYPMSQTKRAQFDAIMKELEEQGVVEDAEPTLYCSPCLIVVQKNKPRLVIDFRKINEMTPLDVYPLPRQKDIFPKLQNSEYITLLDFKKAFYQMPVHPDDRAKVTFSTRHGGAKRLTRSLMGYINSPAHCQRVVDRIIRAHRWEFVIIYVDDIIIFSRDWASHLKHVKWVIDQIQTVGLTLDPAKAHIGFRSVELLGHEVNRFGLATQKSKVLAMTEMPVPQTLHELRVLLGFFNYYREYVRNYAQIVQPMSVLIKELAPKGAELSRSERSCRAMFEKINLQSHWGKDQQSSFDTIKAKLRDATCLSHALEDDDAEYLLYVDACKLGFGAALHIKLPAERVPPEVRPEGKKHVERPVAFISKSLTRPEQSYWPTELEMGALVWALKSFEEIIENKKLTIYTDHSALTWLFASTDSKTKYNQRLLIWVMLLQQWKPKASLIHRPGRAHLNADVLSRFPVDIDTPDALKRSLGPDDCPPASSDTPSRVNAVSTTEIVPEFKQKIVQGYDLDKHWAGLVDKLSTTVGQEYHSYKRDVTGLVYFLDPETKEWKLCVPRNCFTEIFSLFHDELGHCGFKKSIRKLVASVQLQNASKHLRAYIETCPTCATSKNKDRLTGFLVPLDLESAPGNTISMDFVVQLPLSNGFDAILTVTDKFSKMVTLIPCKTNDDARKTAERWLHGFYKNFGMPKNIISDRDVKFVSKFWRELFTMLNCKLLMSTAFSPQTDGQSERTNQTMEVMLRCFTASGRFANWYDALPHVEFVINSLPSAASGRSPFEILYGTNPRSMESLKVATNESVRDIVESRDLIRKEVTDQLGWARATMSMHYDAGRHAYNFQVGESVYIENRPGLSIPGLSFSKLSPKRFGPFEIIELVGKGACKLALPANYKMHPVISSRHLTAAKKDEHGRMPPRPPACIEDEETPPDSYEVESVIDKRTSKNRRRTEYLVKWLGYPTHEASWINEKESASFSEAVKDYELRLKDRLAQNNGQSRLRSKKARSA